MRVMVFAKASENSDQAGPPTPEALEAVRALARLIPGGLQRGRRLVSPAAFAENAVWLQATRIRRKRIEQ